MSKIAKSKVTVDGNTVHMSMPFAKVDEAKRLVHGFATLDNLDSQGDVVLAEASLRAFSRARGNIREMHQPLAVGKMVDFVEREYFDNGKIYRGIYVTARVSEGAEDTWKKCLDGTLSGFSIGGEIRKASNEFSKEAGVSVRNIEDYDLTELSLVDNPANQLSNFDKIEKSVLSFTKSSDGSFSATGMAVETKIENVFVCSEHDEDIVTISQDETEECPMCGTVMENAGWFESGEGRTEKVQRIVNDFLSPAEQEAAPNSDSEGGVEMGVKKNDSENVEEVVEETTPETEETTDEVAEDVTEIETEEEPAESPEEVVDPDEEIGQKIDELHKAVTDSLEKTRIETAEAISGFEHKVEEIKEEFLSKASELEKKLDGFGDKLEVSKNRLSELENALEKMNSADAVKKSADLNDEPAGESVQKSTSWNGAFSGKRTRFSVDNLT